MLDAITTVLGGTAGLVLLVGAVLGLALAGFLPLMVWSAARSLKGIRAELKQLNYLITTGVVERLVREEQAGAPLVTPPRAGQAWTATGPLKLS